MKSILSQFRPAFLATAALVVVCCGIYPVVVFALAQAFFPAKANGSLIASTDGTVRGSRLIGQPFSGEKYFHPRPSAAGNGYDSTSSGGSNLGPTSQKLRDSVAANLAEYRLQNGLGTNVAVPGDAVTASASGLDPHISPANARLQAARVARARGMTVGQVLALIAEHTDQPAFGILGEPGVNVLKLNLALDAVAPAGQPDFKPSTPTVSIPAKGF